LRCWAEVREADGFDVVALNVISPDSAPDFTINEGTSDMDALNGDLPGTGSFLAGRWSFVVVANARARPVYSMTRYRTAGTNDFPTYTLVRGAWAEGFVNACSSNGEPRVWDSSYAYQFGFSLGWISACSE
jgi:hypothetical protein